MGPLYDTVAVYRWSNRIPMERNLHKATINKYGNSVRKAPEVKIQFN